MKPGASEIVREMTKAGYKMLDALPGEKVFPATVGNTTVYVKNTNKLSVSVHPDFEMIAASSSEARNVKVFKNSNQYGFPPHIPSTGELFGIGVEFETASSAISFLKEIERAAS